MANFFSKGGAWALRAGNLVAGSRLSGFIVGGLFTKTISNDFVYERYESKSEPKYCDTAIFFAMYGVGFFLTTTGGGRIPLNGKSVAYIASQVGVKGLDVAVVSTCIMAKSPERGSFLEPPEEYHETWKVALGVLYFGVRMLDGWYVANMPINTLPFVSIGSKLLSFAR